MIGYFFWHWPGGKALDVYERDLLAFHSALRAHHPDGFSCCTATRVAGAPWIPGARGYEDRYLVDSFAALGTLNELLTTHGGAPTLIVKTNGEERRTQTADPLAELNRVAATATIEAFQMEQVSRR